MRASYCATILWALALIAVEFPTATAQETIQIPNPAAGDSSVRGGAPAPEGDVLSLAEVGRLALAADPTIPLFGAKATALRERAVAARALPDPKLRMGFMSVPVDTFDLKQEPMTQVQVGIQQVFPKSGVRVHRAEQSLALARSQSAQADQRRRLVLREAGELWVELFYWIKADAVVRDNEELFGQMVRVATSLYSQGKSNQSDILRAELELNLIDERLLRIRQMQDQARAKLTLWLDAPTAQRPLPSELPEFGEPPPLEMLHSRLTRHPLVLAQDSRVSAGQSGVALAQDQFNSQWSVAVTYGYRPGTAPDGSEWADFISVGVMVDLPFFTENLQDRGLEASLEELNATRMARDDVLGRLGRELNERYSNLSFLQERLALYDRELLSLVADNSEASLRAYQNDVVDFATLVRARITELETRLKWWRLRADLAKAMIRLKYFDGDEK